MILEASEVKEIDIVDDKTEKKASIKEEHKQPETQKESKIESVKQEPKEESKATEPQIETNNKPIDISPEVKIDSNENDKNTSGDIEFNEKDIVELTEEPKPVINQKLKTLDNNWTTLSK